MENINPITNTMESDMEDPIDKVSGAVTLKKLFDDSYYLAYRENNDYIPKNKLMMVLINDINTYMSTIDLSSVVNENNEFRLGYILCSNLSLGSAKMNTILSMLIQIFNPNIRLQSYWETISTLHGPMEVDKRIEIINVHKIRIKLIIKPNDKDFAIKKLASINLHHYAKNSKKVNDYLQDIKIDN